MTINVYAIFPLIATIAYIPLMAITASSRPWQKRLTFFVCFLAFAMLWSFLDYFFRANVFPQSNELLFKLLVILFTVTALQFHVFVTSFYPSGQKTWNIFAYGSMVFIIVIVMMGVVTDGVAVDGDKVHGLYKSGVIFMILPLVVLAARNYYVFFKMLRNMKNPVLHNQIVIMLICITVLTVFTMATLIPMGKSFPISHFGNLLNSCILSYAVMRHRLVDIKIVLRQGSAWLGLLIVGLATYWLLLVILHDLLQFELSLTASIAATSLGILVAVFVYNLRGSIFELMSRVFQGSTYWHRLNLYDFSNSIHNVFSLQNQGGELLSLITKAVDIRRAYLLFPETGSGNFITQFAVPKAEDGPAATLTLLDGSPVINYLKREQKILTRESMEILPEFMSMWEQEKEDIRGKSIDMVLPLISRGNMIAVLALGQKATGMYSLEDLRLLEDVSARVAVSMEKEYLREQLRQREEELSVINRCSTIVASSLDTREIYDSFIGELKTIVDLSWAAIVLVEDENLNFLALSSEMATDWQPGEKVPVKGSGTEWVIANKETVYEPDIEMDSRFAPVQRYLKWGLHSVLHLPLTVKGEVIGSFIVASRLPNAYGQRQITLLEQLAAQIAMPMENARLYAKAEKKARIDGLTALYNRRALDETIDSEISRHSRYGGVFSVAILDLDSFKAYNDSFGHPAGDKLLKQVSRIIQNAIRSADQAFRYGGDEFAVLLPQTGADAARQVTERVRRQIARKIDAGDIKITASIGLASWPSDGIGHTDIIAAADMALYRSKRSGGNRIICASGTLLSFDDMEIEPNLESSEDRKTIGSIYTLAERVDVRDYGSQSHLKAVTECAAVIAEKMELTPEMTSKIEACAMLHDVGKLGISEAILRKPGKLNKEEWRIIKTHPQIGATIVGHVPELAVCAEGITHHHEWYDGSGYPDGLKGEAIPLEARVVAIADAFATMTTKRPHSEALSHDEAMEEIKHCSGIRFDPALVEVFLGIYDNRMAVGGDGQNENSESRQP